MLYHRLTWPMICVLAAFTWHSTSANHDAKRLYDDLLRKNRYNKLIRPGANPLGDSVLSGENYTLEVRLGLRLAQIIDVDEKNEIITMNMWVIQEWYDYKLSWDPKEYGNVDVLYVPSESIWLPDIVLYNNGDGDYTVTLMTKARIHYDGRVYWEPPAIYKSQCNIHVDYFPFDEQECQMKFGTWTYDGNLINLTHVAWDNSTPFDTIIDFAIDLKQYYPNNEWDVMGVVAQKHVIKYTCCVESYIDITFNLTIRRKTLFYTVNLVIPCVAINMLTVLAFYLPADCGEKISLCISILLSLSLFQLLLMDLMPPTSLTMPLLGKYILFTCAVVTISVFSSVIVLNVHFRSTATHEMPNCTRKLFINILPRLLFMHRPQDEKGDEDDEVNDMDWSCNQSDLANYENPYKKKFKRIVQQSSDEEVGAGSSGSSSTLQGTSFVGFDASSFNLNAICQACAANKHSRYPPNALKAMDGMLYIAKHVNEENENKRLKCEWKYVGLVVDRLLLWIYTSVCIVGALAILINAPVIFDQKKPLCVNVKNHEPCIPVPNNTYWV